MIELLIAVGFSMIIVMVAMMTFRSAQKAMGRLDELAAENKMIRAGYYLALQDADYWQSHADPTYPYMAHFNSADMLEADGTFRNDADLAGGLTSGGTTWSVNNTQSDTTLFGDVTSSAELANSAWDVRPFRRTVWRNAYVAGGHGQPTFANPNLYDASDPRAWYRNHLRQGVESGVYMRSTMDPPYRYFLNWDFRPECVADTGVSGDSVVDDSEFCDSFTRTPGEQDCFYGFGGVQVGKICTKKGWSPWHLVGDYAQISNCEGLRRQGESVVANADELAGIADYRSGLMWYTQAMLGLYGMYNYMRPGELTVLQASSVNMTQSAYAVDADQRQNRDFRKGEIPWSLNAGGADLSYRREMAVAGAAGAGSTTAYPQAFNDDYPLHNRLNYWGRMPTRFDTRREQALVGSRYAFLSDFDSYCAASQVGILGRGRQDQLVGRVPLGLFYPRLPQRRRITLETYDWSRSNLDVIKPIAPLYWPDLGSAVEEDLGARHLGALTAPNAYLMVAGNHHQVMESRHTSRTWHLPQSYANDQTPDLRGLGLEGMAMATSILRYRHLGNEVAKCTVLLHKDSSNAKLRTMSFNVFSTTLRGARQYWGRKSGSAGMDDGFGNTVKIGDVYE